MSLFGVIQQSAGALNTAQVGLQVVGNNIANANTEGYIRQRLEQAPAAAFRDGGLITGQGVRPTGITQVIDQALAERLFNARTAVEGSQGLQTAYDQLEQLASDLNGGGLAEQFTQFNNALHDLSTQPNDSATREFVIIQAESLAAGLQGAREKAGDLIAGQNDELSNIATQINRLTEQIAELNFQIVSIEGGRALGSDATGLRDERYLALEELASFVNINFQEQESGNVSVFVGGDFLVNNRTRREVYAAFDETADGVEVRIVETDAALQATGGRLGAAIQARGSVFGNYVDGLDQVASHLIRSVNEVHSQGQGRTGFDSVVGANSIDAGVPISQAGFANEPKNGTFDFNVVDNSGELISTTRIDVRNLGQFGDSTVSSIAAELNEVDGVTASISSDGRLLIESDSDTSKFTFGEDTSGFLAATGINTFFVGTSASDIEVNSVVLNDIDLLAISKGGVGQDTDTLFDLLDIIDQPVEALDGRSVRGLYENIQGRIGQQSSLQSSATDGLADFYSTLQSQHLAITGVNIDEESIKLIAYQRAFQASSRVISTATEMLEILLAL